MMNEMLVGFIDEFSEDERIWMLALGVAVVIIIILIVISFVLIFKKRRRKQSLISSQNTRIYILDLKNKVMKSFDKQRMRDVKTIPLYKFYEQFDSTRLKTVESWIDSLLVDPEGTKGFLESHIKESKSNKTEFVLLEVTSVNKEKKIIHLESHLLPRLSASSTRHNGQRFLLPYDVIQAKYNELVKTNKKRGSGCLIRLYFKQSVLNASKKYSLGALTIQAMNLLSTYLKETRCACLTDINEIFIFDTAVANRSQFFSLANELVKKINGYLTMNSVDDDYGVCIGGTMFDPSLTNMKTFIAHCRDMVSYAENDYETSVALYEENSNKLSLSSSLAYNELASIIHNRAFRYYFTPIISFSDSTINSYILNIVPFGTTYKEFNSIIKDASNLNLLQSIMDIVLSDYRKTARGDELVIMQTNVEILELLLEKTIDTRNKKLMLLFDCDQIQFYADNKDNILEKLKKIKVLGYSIGLSFEDVPSVTLQSNLLRIFDTFVLAGSMANDLKRNKRAQADIILMDNIYNSYQKPIVITLKTLASAEVAVAMGFKYFSCLEFANTSSVFEELDEKQKKYLIGLNKKVNKK